MTGRAVRTVRNVTVDASAPVSTWPYEALVALLERGSSKDWAVLTGEIDHDPWGPVARQVEEYLAQEEPPGLAPLLRGAIARSRDQAEAEERAQVCHDIARLVSESGLGMGEFARRIGTSRSRLSTYRNGRVVPSATLVKRMERVAAQAHPHSVDPSAD